MKLLTVVLCLSFASGTFAWEAQKEFMTNCATCHTIGGGDKIGPDLANVTKRRDIKWLTKYIQYPSGMMEGDPEEKGYEKADPIAAKIWAAYKPNMMSEQDLSAEQIKKLMDYIEQSSKGKEPKGKILTIK